MALTGGLWACGGGSSGESDPADVAAPEVDSAPIDAAVDAGPPCDVDRLRANGSGPYTCKAAPEFLTLDADDGTFDIFTYEASHPLATATLAFPCAEHTLINDLDFQAPDAPTEACSLAGVRPWHTVRWVDADAACTRIGWRLCTGAELRRACGGPQDLPYTYGGNFENGKCNFRESYLADGDVRAGEAPTGEFTECVSPEGVHDANGNLWEWISDPRPGDTRGRVNQGAGWRTIPERHRDTDLTCGAQTDLPGVTAGTYANGDVGFRCCRDHP